MSNEQLTMKNCEFW